MQLFNYNEAANGMYEISYRPKKAELKHFNKVMAIIGQQKNAKYIGATDKWLVNASTYQNLVTLNKEIYPTAQDTIKKKMNAFIESNVKDVGDTTGIGDTLKLQPYQYQKDVIKFATDTEQCLVVAPCGAGKSMIMIGCFAEARKQGKIKGPGLIVVKASLKAQWAAEVKKFSDYTPRVLKTPSECAAKEIRVLKKAYKQLEQAKNQQEKEVALANIEAEKKNVQLAIEAQFKDADLLICNYETLNDAKIRTCLHKMKIEFIAADEIHYIKSDGAKRAKSLCEFNNVKMKIGATATPLQRDPRDIYGIFRFINPELFQKKGKFDAAFIVWGSYGRVSGSKNEKILNKKISPYTIIKHKEEVAKQLPKLVVSQRYCDMDPAQIVVNDQLMVELEELHKQEQKLTGGLPMNQVRMTPELKQIEARILMRQTFAQELCDSERLLLESDSDAAKNYCTGKADFKLDLMIELLEEIIDSGEKVAIFSRFKRMQDIITDRINAEAKKNSLFKMNIAYVNGSLSGDKRFEEVQKFKNDDSCKVLLLSDAGAEGISLGWCSYLIEMDLASSYAIQTQRHGRIQRADSIADTAHVYQLIANGSYDEIAMKIVNKKERYDAQIIHGEDLEDE